MKYFLALLYPIVIFAACPTYSPSSSLANDNLELASRYFTEVYNQDRINLIDTLFVENYEHTNTEGRKFTTREELKNAVSRIENLLPGLVIIIEEAIADTEKVIFVVRMESDLPAMKAANTKATKTSFNEIFVFWIKEGKIYKGRSIGAHLPFIKQVSGFEGGLLDVIDALKVENDSLKTTPAGDR
jgi:hypothetical protein